jgi:hypothetical protein
MLSYKPINVKITFYAFFAGHVIKLRNLTVRDTICSLCDEGPETEEHLLLACKSLNLQKDFWKKSHPWLKRKKNEIPTFFWRG